MIVVLLTNDLMVSSRVEGAAAKAGVKFKAASTIAAMAAECRREPASLVVVDLSVSSLDVNALVCEIKSLGGDQPVILAFGPHVHEALLAAARAAGCDEVMSRGQFFAQLDVIMRQAAAQGDVGGSGPAAPVSPG